LEPEVKLTSAELAARHLYHLHIVMNTPIEDALRKSLALYETVSIEELRLAVDAFLLRECGVDAKKKTREKPLVMTQGAGI
jgi:hypothetical protein